MNSRLRVSIFAIRPLRRRSPMLRNLSLAVVALIPVACGTLRGQEDSTTEPTAKLSTEETRLAIRLAEQTVSRSRGERVYFIKTDLLPASDADARRNAR